MDVGGEIRLGSMLFTLVEPHRGHEVAYNRWYERDHFYAGCMIGPWLFAGRRWVATRDLKALRFPEPGLFGPLGAGSYLAVYFVIEGKFDEHFGWGLRQVKWLHANDRMFEQRDHVHTLLYRYEGAVGPGDGVPPDLALDHPFAGLVATVVDLADGRSPEDVTSWLAAAATTSDGALRLLFRPVPLNDDAPVTQPGLDRLDRRVVILAFLDHHPTESWDAQRDAAKRLAADGIGSVVWASPFIPTIPGTDTYTDRLW